MVSVLHRNGENVVAAFRNKQIAAALLCALASEIGVVQGGRISLLAAGMLSRLN